ncbi:DUF7331 family protein [Haloarcula laminariae]|uniref:DUF7331 family protein n=1 Tax=Haloarcula laminariae TaxID=2961577 RepID=UPI0021CA2FFE|nr:MULTISPECIES: hypothetical protein [Halomicroarcula]
MDTTTSEPADDQSIRTPERDDYDRYSHITTETAEIIYDTQHDTAWIQATGSVRLEEWR